MSTMMSSASATGSPGSSCCNGCKSPPERMLYVHKNRRYLRAQADERGRASPFLFEQTKQKTLGGKIK